LITSLGSTSGAYFLSAGVRPFWKMVWAMDMATDPAKYWQRAIAEEAAAIASPDIFS
jgi:hypothetical protein